MRAKRICSVGGCGRRLWLRELCHAHYIRLRDGLDVNVPAEIIVKEQREARFWARVDKSGDCWVWKGCVDRNGYGQAHLHGRGVGAHRAAWMLTFGPIPSGQCVCHRCDNPSCVHPDHLFLGTHEENMIDMKKKGRLGRASDSGVRKLKASDVPLIRERAANGEPRDSIARSFGVTRGTIRRVITRKAWGHVA